MTQKSDVNKVYEEYDPRIEALIHTPLSLLVLLWTSKWAQNYALSESELMMTFDISTIIIKEKMAKKLLEDRLIEHVIIGDELGYKLTDKGIKLMQEGYKNINEVKNK